MVTTTMTLTEEFRRLCCSECSVIYFYPERWCTIASRDAKSWTCPNGHGQHFGESGFDKLRRERDQLKQRQCMLEDEKRAERERADKAEAATKRLKKRAAAGNCPACKRTFSNMAEHMKHMHPQFVCDTGAKVVPLARPASRVKA